MKKKITWGDYTKGKEDQKRLRIKVSYKEKNPEDQYRFNLRQAIEESQNRNLSF